MSNGLTSFTEKNPVSTGYIRIGDGENVIRFLDNGTEHYHEEFETNGVMFNAADEYDNEGELFIGSKRLLSILAKKFNGSVEGKTLVITRSGEGFKTNYQAELYADAVAKAMTDDNSTTGNESQEPNEMMF